MRYARLVNNVVVEVIDFNPQGCFTDEIVQQFAECPDNVEQGWTYDNDVWTPPLPSIASPQPPSFEERLTAAEQALVDLMGV